VKFFKIRENEEKGYGLACSGRPYPLPSFSRPPPPNKFINKHDIFKINMENKDKIVYNRNIINI
jgi:hypothetical protein